MKILHWCGVMERNMIDWIALVRQMGSWDGEEGVVETV